MKSGKRVFLLLLLAVAGCHSARSLTPEETGEMPYGLWEFAFFTPKALPALVTYVGIIDDKNILYSFRTLDSTQDSYLTVGTWNDKVGRHGQFNKARHPPVAMLFCWDSTIDKKTYETRIIFPESLRSRMSVSTGVDRYGEKAWYDTLLFGLAPGGKVKVWLQNTVGGNGTIPVEPKKNHNAVRRKTGWLQRHYQTFKRVSVFEDDAGIYQRQNLPLWQLVRL